MTPKSNQLVAGNAEPVTKPDSSARRAIRFKSVLRIVPLCPARIYELIAEKAFPQPFKLVQGGRAAAFWEHEIYEWLEQRATEGRQ